MNMRLLNYDKFFKVFAKYYKINIPDVCFTSFVARKSLTINYYKPATDTTNKLKVMTFNFSAIDNLEIFTADHNLFLLEVEIPLQYDLDGIVIDNSHIKEYIEKINLFLPIFKKNNPFLTIEEKSIKLTILFSLNTSENGTQQFIFKKMQVSNNIRYRNQHPFLEDNEEDFLLSTERIINSFLEKMNVDYENMNYKEKISIFDMIVI